MYQVIARKYRPQTFSELLGQEHVRATLENAISLGRIAHGYIFAGQRGTGKTTVARIMARCLNCVEGVTPKPCGVCASCRETSAGNSVDVIEIDAASNRGINEMRELRENVRYRPARDRYKVFIIDEAHQITSEAFNALLKTLEEPPEWVVFILCTTESHKIPTTIASRCQQFSFRSVAFGELMDRMRWICGEEGVQVDDDVLAVLAQAGEGSVRDSLSALDQAIACCGSSLKAEEIRELLGMFSLDSLGQVTEALSGSDSKKMLEIVLELERNGRNLQHFCRELARYFRNLLVARIAGADARLIAASPREQERLSAIAAGFSEEDLTRYLQLTLDLFRDLQFSLQPRLHLEVGLLRLVHAGRLIAIEEALSMAGEGGAPPPTPPRQAPPRPASGSPPVSAIAPPRMAAPAAPPPVASVAAPKPAPPPAAMTPGGWKERLHAALLERGLTFSADAIEHSEVGEAGGELRIVAPKEFLLAVRSSDVQKTVHELAGRPMKIAIAIGQAAVSAAPPAQKEQVPDDEVARRALSHPEVQRFQELFPDSHVRVVRNLKE